MKDSANCVLSPMPKKQVGTEQLEADVASTDDSNNNVENNVDGEIPVPVKWIPRDEEQIITRRRTRAGNTKTAELNPFYQTCNSISRTASEILLNENDDDIAGYETDIEDNLEPEPEQKQECSR
jgi:hypothetical protein